MYEERWGLGFMLVHRQGGRNEIARLRGRGGQNICGVAMAFQPFNKTVTNLSRDSFQPVSVMSRF